MNPSTAPLHAASVDRTPPAPPTSPPAPSRLKTAWFASYRLLWLDDLELPRWAPEGDPSAAVRIREL